VLLTITTTHRPATDLGYLLAKNPARTQSFEETFGRAHVFYPEATEERCTATLLLDVDTVGLVRGRGNTLDQYVNDRPYVASSLLSVAISRVYGTALGGRSRERPELAGTPIPLSATVQVIPCRGGEGFLRKLFEPLGYAVSTTRHPLDERFPEWGESPYYTLTLERTCTLRELLTHLYVLVPVLDDQKHYFIGDDEVEKLLRHGKDWLGAHPERNAIARRYLKRSPRLTREALARLAEEDNPDPDAAEAEHAEEEEAVEKKVGLGTQRMQAVVAALKESGARRVLDLGCGEGRLLRALLAERQFEKVVGMDVSAGALERARGRLRWDQLSERQRSRVELVHGSLTYRDRRLEGFDAAAVVEVIEHLDPPRLVAFERVLLAFIRPGTVVMTTPNAEYNVMWESLPAGRVRHKDHRFEWTRAQFQSWAEGAAARHGYTLRFLPIGPEDPNVGAPTQMGIFSRD
jgi:3' terminal RNA ribose 2'-O-methyltransferase Hen1